MKRWRIGGFGATEVYLHPAMLLYALYAFLIGHGWYMFIATISIVLHEGAHAFVALLFGKPPSCIEITPMGAVMRMEEDRYLPTGKQILVLLAGPMMTFILAVSSIALVKGGFLTNEIGYLLFISNLSILLLNLLPVHPLDGGRILALVLCCFISMRKVTRIMRVIGCIIGIGLIVTNVYTSIHMGGWNLSLTFAGCCILYGAYSATTPWALAELRYFLDRKIWLEQKKELKVMSICALHTLPVRMLIRKLPQRKAAEFLCIEVGSGNVRGRIFETQLIQQYLLTPEVTFGELTQLVKNAPSLPKYDTI